MNVKKLGVAARGALSSFVGAFQREPGPHDWKLPKYRRMVRIHEIQPLPKHLKVPRGFIGLKILGASVYLVKRHGRKRGETCIRLETLEKHGLVTLAA